MKAKREFSSTRNFPLCIVMIITALAVASCASTQRISVESDPAGARVLLMNVDSVKKTSETTPTVITIKKSEQNAVVLLEKSGFDPMEVELKRKLSGRWIPIGIACNLGLIASSSLKGDHPMAMVAGSIVFNALYWPLGPVTGDAYKQSPGKIYVRLTESAQPTTESP